MTHARISGFRTWELDGDRVIAHCQSRTGWLHRRHKLDARCFYCRRETHTGNPTHPLRATVDHYVPLIRKGPDRPHNWRLACRECNGLKGGMMPRDWWDELANA